MTKNQKIFKWIDFRGYWSNCKCVRYTSMDSSQRDLQTYESYFFQISESFFELTTIFWNNSGVGFMHARRQRHFCFGEIFMYYFLVHEYFSFTPSFSRNPILKILSTKRLQKFCRTTKLFSNRMFWKAWRAATSLTSILSAVWSDHLVFCSCINFFYFTELSLFNVALALILSNSGSEESIGVLCPYFVFADISILEMDFISYRGQT